MNIKFLPLAFLLAQTAWAQITITDVDMPNPGDNITVSVKTTLNNHDWTLTGENHTWDFSDLVLDSQRVEQYMTAVNTPYPFFGFLSDYGSVNHDPDPFPFSLLGTPPEQPYKFYREDGNYFRVIGEGLTVGGQMLPLLYTSADVIYNFPVNYGDGDMSISGFNAPIPGMGFYGKEQIRVNDMDGWGTLITPYGTFDVLRVHATLDITDTIFLDTLGFGISIPRGTVHEYKWIAAGSSIPILQINTVEDLFGGTESLVNVIYQDSVYIAPSIIATNSHSCPYEPTGSLEAIVVNGKKPYTYLWDDGSTVSSRDALPAGEYTVSVTDAYGRSTELTATVGTRFQDLACLSIPTAFTPNGDGINEKWVIKSMEEYPDAQIKIFNRWGSLMFSSEGYKKPWDGTWEGGRAPEGAYYYFITLKDQQYNGTVTIVR